MSKPSKKVGKNRSRKPTLEQIVPATDAQRVAVGLMEDKQVVVMEGLAGTGKTFLAIHHALTKLFKGDVRKIILTRPLTTVGNEKLGFLPGDVNEKVGPYAEQMLEYLEEFSPMISFMDAKEMADQIEFIPLAYLRGRNFKDSVIIADEMQNSSYIQMKTLLTRIAETTQLLILGDTKQKDIPGKEDNGLDDLLYRMSTSPGTKEYFGHIRFGIEDIQRSELVKHVMRMYDEI